MGKLSSDYQALLSFSNGSTDNVPTAEVLRQRSTRLPFVLSVIIVFQGLLNIVLIGVGLSLYSRRGPTNPLFPEVLYSPAQDVVEYEVVKFTSGLGQGKSIYQGEPSPEVDAAWEYLYSFGISQIPKSQAAQLANKTAPIPGDETNYIVGLDVFHQIHCLNMIRQALDPTHYPPSHPGPEEDKFHGSVHIGHCIDSIRQSLMCSADISTIVWQWDEELQRTWGRVGDTIHTCRNFDKIWDWGRSHHIKGPFDISVHLGDDIVIPEF